MPQTRITRTKAAPAARAPAKAAKGMNISDMAVLMAADSGRDRSDPFRPAEPMRGVIPNRGRAGSARMAMDDGIANAYSYAAQAGAYAEGLQFLGYPYLAELTQRAEYRRPAEILAKHMTRKWIRLQSKGDDAEADAKREKLDAIEAEFTRLNVKGVFRKAIEIDGFFGRAQIYLDMKGVDTAKDLSELKTPLRLKATKIGPAAPLERMTVVEPIWTYPHLYESLDPLSPVFYKPQAWFVMGKEVHSTRLLTIVSRQVPDILKPAYSFGGLSLSQMAKPYVDNWLRTRQSVADLIHSFSVMGLKTNLSTVLDGGGAEIMKKRAQMFSMLRDNRGTMMLDKDTEDFFNVSVPLSGLDHLQAQTQEHMSSVTGIPLSILLGITPSGLNASTEGEFRQFYDWIEAQQEANLTPPVTYVLQVVQLSLFGEIDPDITFMWEPLWSMDGKQLSEIRKADADAAAVYIQAGVISPHEERARLASDDESPYASLDLDDDPPPPMPDPDAEGDPSNEEESEQAGGAEDGGEFNEGDHPRAGNGKFGAGNGGAGAGKESGPFGPVLTGFHHDAGGAVAKLMEMKSGDAIGALHHPEIGDIDLVWGKEGSAAKDFEDGYGLAKIAKKHPEVLEDLQGALDGATVGRQGKNRVILESPTHHATVRLDWDGERKHWLLTAFEKGAGAGTRTGTDGLAGKGGQSRVARDRLTADSAAILPDRLHPGVAAALRRRRLQ